MAGNWPVSAVVVVGQTHGEEGEWVEEWAMNERGRGRLGQSS